MRAAFLALLLLANACTHVQVNASSSTGTSTSSAGLQIQGQGSGTLAAVVLAGMLISGAVEDVRNPRPFPSLSVFSDWMRGTPAPPMQPDRAVSEQDCTKPVELGDNLKCR